jgi:AcrR family transcriptional regulator
VNELLPIDTLEPAKRKLDPERTRQAILAAAHDEFALHGLSGARVDAIAARTHTVKRMIYYYFGSKEGLYLAVLEEAYAAIRTAEAGLNLDSLPPIEAIRRMVEFTFDYQAAHPDFVRLVSIENIHHGRFIAQSARIQAINISVLDMLRTILHRGQDDGSFRPDLDPVDVHMLISGLAFFRVSNRHTFGVLFQRDLGAPAEQRRHRDYAVDVVLRSLLS